VLLRRAVVAVEALQQGADLAAEEGLRLGHQPLGRQVAGGGMRRRAAAGVEGERDADEGDAEELEQVAHPPAPPAGVPAAAPGRARRRARPRRRRR
jgi:hypothetical protein